jgi:hypothetical protein
MTLNHPCEPQIAWDMVRREIPTKQTNAEVGWKLQANRLP